MSGDREDEVVVRMPQLGEGVTSGVIARMLRPVGSRVREGQPLFEVELDKVCVEVFAPADGVVAAVAVAEAETVEVDAPLCVLRTGDADPPRAGPLVVATRLRWDPSHVRARAGADGEVGEAALLLVALVRALAAVPALLGRPWPLSFVYCDLARDRARWVHAALAPDLGPEAARALVRAGEPGPRGGWPAHVSVLRLHPPATGPARTTPSPRQLCVGVGPVRDEAVVRDARVVARPVAEVELTLGTPVPADVLVAFAAALAEQLGSV
jgi:pyruvate/2-oxoglutarate dehydrogenase complex dihydrolipoamide acyltransferase (E2) component